MDVLLIVVFVAGAYIVAYHTYGRWLARRIFRLNPDAVVPSRECEDGKDYVPTRRSVVFGHHFTSIAGTGPIVGPALAIMWGWVPAVLWIVFGAIFLGAVHDFATLVVSLRNRGMTVGQVAGRLLSPRVGLLFLVLLFFALWIVLAIFGWVIASVFVQFPVAILPVFLQIPIAVGVGWYLRGRNAHLFPAGVVAVVLMMLTVWVGAGCPGTAWGEAAPVRMVAQWNALLADWPLWAWVLILMVYCYIASVLPVGVLLQPRDFINSLQLLVSLGLIVSGLLVISFFGFPGDGGRLPLEIVAPAFNPNPLHAPPLFPFLFVTIACGAISGFHCLVSSGTTSKQLSSETDAQSVGYGSMLLEGFLATLVVIAVAAGIGFGWQGGVDGQGARLWHTLYADWRGVTGGQAIGAFVAGSANFLVPLGIDVGVGRALMGVLVASFAGTTLDTATRLQRYVIQELAATFSTRISTSAGAAEAYTHEFERKRSGTAALSFLTTTHGATLFAVGSALLLALMPAPGQDWSIANIGKGGLILWPLFGATNQLLAGLALLVVAFWLKRNSLPRAFVLPPMFLMLGLPTWALADNILQWLGNSSYLLVGVGGLMLIITAWIAVEAYRLWDQPGAPTLNPRQ